MTENSGIGLGARPKSWRDVSGILEKTALNGGEMPERRVEALETLTQNLDGKPPTESLVDFVLDVGRSAGDDPHIGPVVIKILQKILVRGTEEVQGRMFSGISEWLETGEPVPEEIRNIHGRLTNDRASAPGGGAKPGPVAP